MASLKNADALLTAATAGNVDKIRKHLADGAAIEATNVNRWTPVMCAAGHGHLEAYQMLVEAGAYLHALGMRQTDLLELAVDGGNVVIVRDLLQRGLPVDGHWQLLDPNNPVLRKIGHDTPLIRAAQNGNVEMVRVLLDAGADRDRKHQGKTALDLAKECLRDPDFEDDHPAYREIVVLLGGAGAKKTATISVQDEVARFAENAKRPEYKELKDSLVAKCGPARPWKPVADHGLSARNLLVFTLKGVKKQKVLEELQKAARDAGCLLVLGNLWSPGENAELVLFPTADKFAVVAAVGTEGANHGLKTIPHVIDWLRELDTEQPFHLFLCTHDAVGGAFTGPVKGEKKLADRIARFCPDCLGEGVDDAETLALMLKKSKSFLLRWE